MIRNKLKLIATALIIPVILAGSLTGCGNSKSSDNSVSTENQSIKKGGKFTFAIQTEPDSLDPYKATAADAKELLFNVFEGLISIDTDGNIVPQVAEKYDVSDDSKVYSFKIRDGIKFHNGNNVKAEDVKYSIEQAQQAKFPGFAKIDNVKVIDDSNVQIELKEADVEFLSYLNNAIIPKDYAEQSKKPIGTGAFKFESYTPQQSVVLKRNDDYWKKDKPYLDEVTFKLESDTNALLLDLQSGSIDGAAVDNATANQVDKAKYDTVELNSNAVQQFNLNNNFEPFKNVKVRQAISNAIDKDEIMNKVNDGKGIKVGTPVIPGDKKIYDDTLADSYKKDIEKSKSLLKEAGYENGFEFTITVPSNYKVHVDTAQVIVNQLKEIGVTANIKQVDWATWLSNVYKDRNYEGTIISTTANSFNTNGFLGRYLSDASNNYVNYSNADFDNLYKEALSETDENKRVEIVKKLQKKLSEDAASVYIQDIASINVIKKDFSGVTGYPLYVFDAASIHKK